MTAGAGGWVGGQKQQRRKVEVPHGCKKKGIVKLRDLSVIKVAYCDDWKICLDECPDSDR